MEVARRCPLVMLLLCLLLSDATRAFVLDRHSKEANELTEALKVIQRAKRRLVDDAVKPDTGYLWPDEAGGPYGDEVMGEEGDNELLEDLFAEGPREGVLTEGQWGNDIQEGSEEKEVLEPGTEAVDKAELEDMFEEQNKEDKREYDPSRDAEKRTENTLSNDEVDNLLDTAKDTEVSVLSEGGSIAPVAKEEIKQVLQVAEPNGDGTSKIKIKEDDWLITPEKTLHNSNEDEKDVPTEELTNVNKEWLMNLNEPMEMNIKKKRSGDPVLAEAAAEERAKEEAEEAADLTYIKEFIELEDDENSALANALNLATLSQVERTDKYIPLEVQYLKQSIKDEETIQTIKDSLGIGDQEGEEQEEQADVLENNMEGPGIQEDQEEEAEEEIRDVLSEKLRQFLLRTAIANNDENEIEDNFEDEKWYNVPVNPSSEGSRREEAELNPFLRELLQQMYNRGASVSKRGDQLQMQDDMDEFEVIPDEEEEMLEDDGALIPVTEQECPAVSEYVDNCAYVRSLGMGLDEEALDLCNRHQLCYTCGSYYGLTPEVCDKGFLGEADRLCEGDEECKDEAAGLYFFMLKDHTYAGRDSNGFACAAQCTYDYILGLAKKK